jgi:membrane protein
MILWIIWSWMISLLIGAALPYLQQVIPKEVLDQVINPITKLFPFLASFIVLLIIYRWMPNTRVRWSEAIWGALVSNLAWILLTLTFQWFLRSGLARYDLVYGSLGTSVALLTWTFLSAVIILFGSHISAAIARSRGLAENPPKNSTKIGNLPIETAPTIHPKTSIEPPEDTQTPPNTPGDKDGS